MYTLVYHEHLAFRAAPIQMLLLDAEAEFKMAPPEWGEDRVVAANPGCAVFAPPVLRKGDFTLGQTTAIMDYLGRAHGMLKGSAEQLATANQLTLDVADIGSELFGVAKDAEKVIRLRTKNLPFVLFGESHIEHIFCEIRKFRDSTASKRKT